MMMLHGYANSPFGMIILAHLLALKTKRSPNDRLIEKFSLTRKLYRRGFQRKEVLNLYKFIDWVMVLPKDLSLRYNNMIHELEEERKMAYITTAERIGMEKGYEQGWIAGKTEGKAEGRHYSEMIFLRLLERKFGEVPKHYCDMVARTDPSLLLLWCERILGAKNLAEVFKD